MSWEGAGPSYYCFGCVAAVSAGMQQGRFGDGSGVLTAPQEESAVANAKPAEQNAGIAKKPAVAASSKLRGKPRSSRWRRGGNSTMAISYRVRRVNRNSDTKSAITTWSARNKTKHPSSTTGAAGS